MMTVILNDEKLNKIQVTDIIDAELCFDADAACDSIKIDFCYYGDLPSIKEVMAYDNGDLIFCGSCDVQKRISDKNGEKYFLYARSMASWLTDNEALPTTFFHPTSNQLFFTYCSEYKLKNMLPPLFVKDYYEVIKGKSKFGAVNDFVKALTGEGIRVTPNGEVVALSSTGKKVSLDLLNIITIKKAENRCEPISKIHYKIDSSGQYNHHFESMHCIDESIKKERYVSLASYPVWQRDSLVKNISDESFKNYKTIDLTVIGMPDVSVGDTALYDGRTYKVKSKAIILGKSGLHTRLSLYELIDKRTVNYVD